VQQLDDDRACGGHEQRGEQGGDAGEHAEGNPGEGHVP
jgi:hypothetical protein